MQFIQGFGGMLFGQELTKKLTKPGGYNILNNSYTEVSEDNTAVIDSLIMDPEHGVPGPVIITSGKRSTPAVGDHYYTFKPTPQDRDDVKHVLWVGLIKVSRSVERGSNTSYYVIWEPRFFSYLLPIMWEKGTSPIDRFKRVLAEREKGSLLTYRVDATTYHTSLFSLSVDHPSEMRPHQEVALQFIMTTFRKQNRGTFLISGPRGSGKTTTAMHLKQEIDDKFPTLTTTLITNFSPSQSAVDITRLALRDISAACPYVIVINEVDNHFAIAASDEGPKADKRFTHTENRSTFHDMLDTFSATRYLIVIMTTEKPVEELWANQEYKSFMRSGRVHAFIRMTTSSTLTELNELREDSLLRIKAE